jgi:hypothetical protein
VPALTIPKLKLTGRAHFDLKCFLFVLSEEVVELRQTEKKFEKKIKKNKKEKK